MTNRCMKDLDIFSALTHDEREQIGNLALKRIYRKNETIFREGMEADSIYLIKSGKVSLYKISDEGKQLTLDYLTAEDIFGEAAFFENSTHTMNAMAVEDTFTCCCTKELFVKLLHDPQTALKIVQYLGKKMNGYTEHMSRIAFKDVRGRVLDVLCRLAEVYGRQTGTGLTIALELTHQDIGSLINASRVMVTNVLSALRKEKLIHIHGHQITVCQESVQKYQNRVI